VLFSNLSKPNSLFGKEKQKGSYDSFLAQFRLEDETLHVSKENNIITFNEIYSHNINYQYKKNNETRPK